MSGTDGAPLKKTALYDLHLECGAKMVPFAGYAMPVQFTEGVLREHLHTRAAAGLFDVSHMGQLFLHGIGAAAALEKLVPGEIQGLAPGYMRYTQFTNEIGGHFENNVIRHGDERRQKVIRCRQRGLQESGYRTLARRLAARRRS